MPSALALQTIHSIIDAVENEAPSAGFFSSGERKQRRAQYLTATAHNVLSVLRGEMSVADFGDYQSIYTRVQYAAYAGPGQYLQAAEAFWDFALRVFQDVSYRHITGWYPQYRPRTSPPPQYTSKASSRPRPFRRAWYASPSKPPFPSAFRPWWLFSFCPVWHGR